MAALELTRRTESLPLPIAEPDGIIRDDSAWSIPQIAWSSSLGRAEGPERLRELRELISNLGRELVR